MTVTPSSHPKPRIDLRAAVLAWGFPGLGHISIGQKQRGFGIMAGILGLIICGLLIGGFDCVDRKEDRLWFLAQSVCGPVVFVADYVNQTHIKAGRSIDHPDRLRTIGIGRPNEMGTLYIALAGLMNLIVILDALYYRPREHLLPPPRRRKADSTVASSTPAATAPSTAYTPPTMPTT